MSTVVQVPLGKVYWQHSNADAKRRVSLPDSVRLFHSSGYSRVLSQVLFWTKLGCHTLLSKHEVSCSITTGGDGGAGGGSLSLSRPPGANGQASGVVSWWL